MRRPLPRAGRRGLVFTAGLGLLLAGGVAATVVLEAQSDRCRRAAPPEPRSTSAVDAPLPPRPYAVPAGAVSVSSAAELRATLANAHIEAVVLEDGTYASDEPFASPDGDRLYARRLGGAVLTAGIRVGGDDDGPGGGLLRGLVFRVRDPTATSEEAVIDVGGSGGRDTRILDTTLDGFSRIAKGVRVKGVAVEGLVIERLRARNFTQYAVNLSTYPDYDYVPSNAPLLQDLDLARVSQPDPGSLNGTGEYCLMVGAKATVRRATLRDCYWAGLWIAVSNKGGLHEHIDIDRSQRGIYFEYFSWGSVVRAFDIGPAVPRSGIVCEWADPDDSIGRGRPACDGNVIEDGRIESRTVGVYLDRGTRDTVVRRVRFAGQSSAAILDCQAG